MGGNIWDKNPNRLLDNGTGGVRDTYQPNQSSTWSQAEYAAETEREVAEGKKPFLTRIWTTVRRSIWG
jgi:hypothetical protein